MAVRMSCVATETEIQVSLYRLDIEKSRASELRSCVKIEMAVLGPYGLCVRKATFEEEEEEEEEDRKEETTQNK